MKKLLFAALLWPLLALAQSYPSPTYQNLTVLGTFTSTGDIGLSSLATQAANTVVANVTASSASPTAVALPSCSGANSALQYTSGTGFVCGMTYALTSGTLAQFASTTSAQLAGIISDKTGSGSLVFATGSAINPTSTGATTAGTGAFTTLSASSTVSGTGFSTYLASPPAIGGTTAASGKFTTLQATSTITPSSTAGIVGTATNDNANAGSVGEYATNTTGGVSLTTGTPTNLTSVSLTAGDWDVTGTMQLVPAGGTTATSFGCGTTTTSGAGAPFPNQTFIPAVAIAGFGVATACPVVRFSLSTTTTVYLTGSANFSGSTCTASGFIRARRVR